MLSYLPRRRGFLKKGKCNLAEEDGGTRRRHHTRRMEVAYEDEDGDGVQGGGWRRTRRRSGKGVWRCKEAGKRMKV